MRCGLECVGITLHFIFLVKKSLRSWASLIQKSETWNDTISKIFKHQYDVITGKFDVMTPVECTDLNILYKMNFKLWVYGIHET